jgi:hypothetical protein
MRRMPQQPYSPDLAPVTSTWFLQWKRNSTGLRSLTKTRFWIPTSDFEGNRSGRIEYGISGLGTASSRSKWRQWRLRRMINKFYRYESCASSSDRAGACTYWPDDISHDNVNILFVLFMLFNILLSTMTMWRYCLFCLCCSVYCYQPW